MRRLVALSSLVVVLSAASCAAIRDNQHPVCAVRPPTVLMAESVKGAAFVPCVKALPIGWAFESFDARSGVSTYSLDSDAGGQNALEVSLRPHCAVAGSTTSSGQPGVTLRREVRSTDPYRARWTYTFTGGCAVFAIAFAPGAPVDRLLRDVRRGMSFLSREAIDRTLERRQGQGLDPVSA